MVFPTPQRDVAALARPTLGGPLGETAASPTLCMLGVDVGIYETYASLVTRDQVLASVSLPPLSSTDVTVAARETWQEIVAALIARVEDHRIHEDAPAHFEPLIERTVLSIPQTSALRQDIVSRLDEQRRTTGSEPAFHLTDDLTANLASADLLSEGLVLIAGRGTIAARVACDRVVAQAAEFAKSGPGSGRWLGQQAVEAALSASRGGLATSLVELIAERIDIEPTAAAIEGWLERHDPKILSGIAPLVGEAAANNDDVANAILDAATDALIDSLASLEPRQGELIVLAGGVATAPGMLKGRLQVAVRRKWATEISLAGCVAVGAARIGWRAANNA